MKRKAESRSHRRQEVLQPAGVQSPGFRDHIGEIVFPENKWHYAFHIVVVAVALTYWIGSALSFPDFSWAEFVLYRPQGDNQVWPVVTALSHLNFGDPTDALKYGQGIGGFHAVILLPHALAYALFGARGYMVADAAFSWCYFIAAAVLFRGWGLGRLGSVMLSAALQTGSIQAVLQKLTLAFAKFIALFKLSVAEWEFPDLINLTLASKRIPRPFPTEIFLLLILYVLVRIWQEGRPPSFKRGLTLGALMGLLAQGDPYSFSALGLLSLVVLIRIMWLRQWRIPWRFIGGSLVGVALMGWYLAFQVINQNPDGAVRFGLTSYSRSKFHLLPGYGPFLRILVVACVAMLVRWLAIRHQRSASASAKSPQGSDKTARREASELLEVGANTQFALFALAMVLSAWLAQPVQLLLLGKGAQIYHYFLFTLPTFYSFALLLLLIRLFKLLSASEEKETRLWPPRLTATACSVALPFMFMLGIEESTDAMRNLRVSRGDMTPWVAAGDRFRPSLRGLDKQFQENPDLKSTRTFLTFCQEVNYFVTAFHDKRAYLPDNGFSTLSDKELEERLFDSARICQLDPDRFKELIRDTYTLNFWLGCAKYWYASDHKFATDSDYAPETRDAARSLPPEAAFNLALPLSEAQRLTAAYEEHLKKPADVKNYPDIVILSLLNTIDESLYQPLYTNKVFRVYKKIPRNE